MRPTHRDRRAPLAPLAAMLILTAGCPAADPPIRRISITTTQPATAPAETRAAAEAISLRTAMRPPEKPQPVRLRLDEHRVSTLPGGPAAIQDLHIELQGTLTRSDEPLPRGELAARLQFKRLQIRTTAPDRPGITLTYDSASDRPGTGNPLADLMAHVAAAELSLQVTPTGRLREARGLNPLWHKANLIMAPPALLPVQAQFRDPEMTQLLGEALFPPMPGAGIAHGDRWETDLPADLPMVARLTSHLSGQLTRVEENANGQLVAHLEITGEITLAPDILQGYPPALRPTIKSGTQTITMTVDPDANTLVQNNRRELELTMTLSPPAGGGQQQMTVKQTRTLSAERGQKKGSGTFRHSDPQSAPTGNNGA